MKSILIPTLTLVGLLAVSLVAEDRGPEVVVLLNGGVVQGHLETSNKGIRVTKGPWYAVDIPREDIDFVARKLTDAYRTQLDRLAAGDYEGHARLANWCLRYDLTEEAADRLLYLSNLDPRNRAIPGIEAQLQQKADRGLKRSPTVALASATETVRPEADSDSATPTLSSDTMGEFTRAIQPLILNRCGQATCHGRAGESNFHLNKLTTSTGQRRELTLRNLRAVFAYLDGENGTQTPLYQFATTAHGRSHRAPLEVHETKPRLRLLQWINTTTGKTSPIAEGAKGTATATRIARTPGAANGTNDPMARLQAALDAPTSATDGADSGEVTPAAEAPESPAASDDPYDPALFNSRATATESSESSS